MKSRSATEQSKRLACLAGGALLALGASTTVAGSQEQARPSAVLLVLNKSDNTLALVDPVTLTVKGRVPTGVGPHEVAASADGKTAYVANYGDQKTLGNSLSIIDITSQKVTRMLPLGDLERPHGIAEKGGNIYFTSEARKAVARYNPKQGKVDWTAPTDQNGTHMLVLSPDGKHLYTTNMQSGTASILELPSGKATHIKVGPRPEGVDVSPDGKELWVGQNDDGAVSIIDTKAGTVKQTIPVCKTPIRVKFTPDGKRVLLSDPERGELYVLDAKTRKEIKRITVGPSAVGIQITPDGKRAFVASMADNKVSVVDLNTLTVIATIKPGGMPDGMAWAEDRTAAGKGTQ